MSRRRSGTRGEKGVTDGKGTGARLRARGLAPPGRGRRRARGSRPARLTTPDPTGRPGAVPGNGPAVPCPGFPGGGFSSRVRPTSGVAAEHEWRTGTAWQWRSRRCSRSPARRRRRTPPAVPPRRRGPPASPPSPSRRPPTTASPCRRSRRACSAWPRRWRPATSTPQSRPSRRWRPRIPPSGSCPPTARRCTCSGPRPRRRWPACAPPRRSASPTSPGCSPIRCSRRSPATRGSPASRRRRRRRPSPAPLAGGTARVDGGNTAWDPGTGWLEARFEVDPPPPAGRVLGRQRGDAAYDRLRDLCPPRPRRRQPGDLYDNRDRGHSAPAAGQPPAARPPSVYDDGGARERRRLRARRPDPLRPPDLRQLLDRADRRPALARAAARRADPRRRRRPLAALGGLHGEPDLRLSEPPDLRPSRATSSRPTPPT